MANYPGFCTVDSSDIISQVQGNSHYSGWHRYEGLSNHHPVFYTFLVWLVFTATSFVGSMEVSIFCFCLMQSLLVSGGIAWALTWLNRRCGARSYVALAAGFLVLSPVLVAHAVTVWKDTLFSVALLILLLVLYDVCHAKKADRKCIVALTGFVFLIALLRNNGVYISLLTLIYLFIVLPSFRKVVSRIAAALLALEAILQFALFPMMSISQGHASEALGIPLNQIAAVVASDGEMTEQQREFIDQIIPCDIMAERYNEISVNRVKFSPDFDDSFLETHKGQFIRVWLEMLPSNFATYVRAWVFQTEGYWSPGFQSGIGAWSSLSEEGLVDMADSAWQPAAISDVFRERFPIFFSSGTIVWIAILTFALSLLKSSKGAIAVQLAPFVPLIILLLTLLVAVPTVADFRYILPCYLAIPFLPVLGGLLSAKSDNENSLATIVDENQLSSETA